MPKRRTTEKMKQGGKRRRAARKEEMGEEAFNAEQNARKLVSKFRILTK